MWSFTSDLGLLSKSQVAFLHFHFRIIFLFLFINILVRVTLSIWGKIIHPVVSCHIPCSTGIQYFSSYCMLMCTPLMIIVRVAYELPKVVVMYYYCNSRYFQKENLLISSIWMVNMPHSITHVMHITTTNYFIIKFQSIWTIGGWPRTWSWPQKSMNLNFKKMHPRELYGGGGLYAWVNTEI